MDGGTGMAGTGMPGIDHNGIEITGIPGSPGGDGMAGGTGMAGTGIGGNDHAGIDNSGKAQFVITARYRRGSGRQARRGWPQVVTQSPGSLQSATQHTSHFR